MLRIVFPFRDRSGLVTVVGIAGLAIGLLSGCGGGDSNSSTSAGTDTKGTSKTGSADKHPKTTGGNGHRPTEQTTANGLIRIDSDGRKWFGKVPMDVWFDDPLGVAGDTQSVSRTPTGPGSKPPMGHPSGGTSTGGTPSGGAVDWKSLASMELLNSEVKRIRNELTVGLQSVRRYNGRYKMIQTDGATLSAIGAIAIVHPEPVGWKENARYVRDLGTKIEESSQKLGRKAYDATKLPYEQLVDVLSGNRPAGLPDAEPTLPFSDHADRGGLMKRMDIAKEWLKQNVQTAAVFKEQGEKIRHEASLLAVLGTVTADKSYDSADEKSYAAHARELIAAARAIVAAVDSDDFTGFTTALGRVDKKCDECHVDYRFKDDN